MRRTIFISAFSFVAWASCWIVFSAATWDLASRNPDIQGRLRPYGHAHLREQASLGQYSPLLDPLFALGTLLPTGISFGLLGFFGRQVARTNIAWGQFFVFALAMACSLVLRWTDLASPHSSGAYKMAATMELLVAVASWLLAFGAAAYFGRPKNGS